MCGIAAIIGLNGYQPEQRRLEQMANSIRHRGPDDEGYYLNGRVGFAFRRLSILDLTPEGHQPMVSHNGRYVIIFNGEIYNYLEIREELRTKGHCFRSTGDTEVLLAAFCEWGEQCLGRLNGMWAFLIHDRTTGTVFGSRDRFGVKPLYLHRAAEAIVLASELKAFAASGFYRPDVNWETAAAFLLDGRLDEGRQTLYAGIEQVPAGHCFDIDAGGRMHVRPYWSLPTENDAPPNQAAERFAELFEDAVRLRLRSDVPVGVCLSGGLDSTAIICAMARQRPAEVREQPLYAFSFNPVEFDESKFLGATIAQTGATLVPLETGGNQLWDRFAEVLRAQDEPVHSMTALVGYGLMQLARERGVTVVLNGQGADETIGGYPSFFRDYWRSLLTSKGLGTTVREIGRHSAVHGTSMMRALTSVLRHSLLLHLGTLEPYRRLVQRRRQGVLAAHPWYRAELAGHWAASPGPVPDSLYRALSNAVEHDPLPLYLRVEDRNSMAHSVEARLPFLDYRLVSFLFTLPAMDKMRGPWNKFILREAMRGRIPESVRSRVEKFGFPTPVQRWVAESLHEPLADILGSQRARGRGIYHTDRLLADLERVRRGDASLAGPLVRVAQFELWSTLLEERSGVPSIPAAMPALGNSVTSPAETTP